jgi:D-alanyl-D-alanine carboxypeptidase (penicillin-binding protein 5/6)
MPVLLSVLITVGVGLVGVSVHHKHEYLTDAGWPAAGQAAYAVGNGPLRQSSGQEPVPIASVAKVMTAYLVLQSAPLATTADGFTMQVSAADSADTARRASEDQSLVPVHTGEVLTERQALAALLLPSANNVAAMLAIRVAGSQPAFVAKMNATARRLGMSHTTYTDPSGFDPATQSTAADQLRLAQSAMRNATFAAMVALPSFPIPVAGVIHNTDTLLGKDGFVGIKTGSDDAAGGCFMFRSIRKVHGHTVLITGVVLGQPGHDPLAAGQQAAKQLVNGLAD